MTTPFQDEYQSHTVLRKLLSTRRSDKEATTFDYTEFTIGSFDKAYCEIHCKS